MRTVAPAKINWTLEVLGRRDDGYHEIRSVMQTIDLCDELQVSPAPELIERSKKPTDLPPGTLVLRGSPHDFNYAADHLDPGGGVLGESVIRVVQMLDPEWIKDARVSLMKKVPVGAGLGGGSSDAAAALRCLDRLWGLGLEYKRLVEVGFQIGSDVAFFLSGGTALAEGRGERITPLPDAPTVSLVVLAPPIRLAEKTKRMYEALSDADFSDGSRSEVLSQRLREGEAMREEDLCNVFERVAYKVFEGLETYREALIAAGAEGVNLAGAGPALFALTENEAAARELAGRVQTPEARVFVTRTLTAREATVVTD